MSNFINTNIGSLNSQKNLNRTNSLLAKTMERLSSGYRINSASDDAAGLAITERQTAQIKAYAQAIRNANDGISLSQAGESSINEVSSNLQRMRELAVQSSNGTYTSTDRISMQREVKALQEEIGRSLRVANFNGTSLFFNSANSNFISSIGFQIGANQGGTNSLLDSNQISLSLQFDITLANGSLGSVNGVQLGQNGNVALFDAMMSARIFAYDSTTSGVYGGTLSASKGAVSAGSLLSIATQSGARYAINWIDSALRVVNDVRASFGALHNRFSSTIRNLEDMNEATQSARSRIRDADIASETAELTKQQILQQMGVAMLGISKNAQQGILSLFQ